MGGSTSHITQFLSGWVAGWENWVPHAEQMRRSSGLVAALDMMASLYYCISLSNGVASLSIDALFFDEVARLVSGVKSGASCSTSPFSA